VQKLSRLTSVILVAIAIPIVPFLVVGELPGERWLSRADDNALLFAITGSGLLTLDIALPVPSSLVGTALGARLGFWAGSLCCWLGLTAGNLLGYGFGHLYPRRLAASLPPEPMGALVFLSRPVPVIAEAVALTAGATRMPLTSFALSCALGNGIYALALCANASFWLAAGWRGPALIFPMLLPVLAWFAWRRLGPQSRMQN
jgi:uncharacterized membrane protein YdjX (TVP38/TMEM64 family)